MGNLFSKKNRDETALKADGETQNAIPPKKPTCCSRLRKKFGLPSSPCEFLHFESRIDVETALKDVGETQNAIPPEKPTCCSRLWKKFDLPCSPLDSLHFESRIVVEEALWQEYCTFSGHFEYYGVQQGRHGAVCFRRADGVETDSAALVELLIRRPNGRDKQWFIQVRRHKWNPEEAGAVADTLTTSQHKWSAISALDALSKYSVNFGKYNPIRRNCRDFVEGLKKSMIANGPARDVPSTHDYWEIGKFLQENHKVHFARVPTDSLMMIVNEEDLAAADPVVQSPDM